MCNKKILAVLTILGFSFPAFADETETQKFYDRDLLTETLLADDQEALVAAQEENLVAIEADQAAADALQADLDAQAALDADIAAAEATAAAESADPTDPALDQTAAELQAIADETDAEALQLAADETDAEALQVTADEADATETAEALTAIEAEFSETETFVEGLTDEQVFALNRSLNNAVNSGLLVDIDAEDLALIEDANKLQINAFTQAFEQEARFLLKADKFTAKAEESGDDKFLEIGDRMTNKAEDQKTKFISKIERFADSPSATADSIAKGEAKVSAKAAAKDTSKGVAKATAKQAAKAAAKETAKAAAKETAKTTAKQAAKTAAKGVAKAEAKRSARAAAKKG